MRIRVAGIERGRNGVKWPVGAIESLVGDWIYQCPRKKAGQWWVDVVGVALQKKKFVPIFKGGTFEFRGIHHMITVAQTDEDFVLLLGNTIRYRNSIFQQLTALRCVCLGIVDAKDESADAPFLNRRWVVSWAHIRPPIQPQRCSLTN